MHRRIAGLAGSLLALLAGCEPAGGSGRASIVSVSPEQIDRLGDDAFFGVAPIQVVLSGETSQVVCGSSSGEDFPIVFAERVDASRWVVTFHVAPALPAGAHVGELEVFLSSDPGCSLRDGEGRRIPYRLTKVDAFAWPDPVPFLVATSETTAAELTARVRIDMASGPQHAWTARSTSPWLVVDTAQGLTGDDLVLHVDPTATGSNLVNTGDNPGRVEIIGDTAGMSPRWVNVYLFLRLAEARAAMPADQPAGPARRFRVHGIGFTAEAMAGARLSVEGVPGAVFTRLGDSDLAVELPAATPAGSYRVTATNALDVPVGAAMLRLTAPVATTRTVLPGNGAGGRMLWDGARSALLVLESPPGRPFSFTLRRHLLQDGAWSTTTAPAVDALRRMSISPDGTQLLATSALNDGGGIYALDPERLLVRGYGSAVAQVPEEDFRAPLAVTVDEWAWYGTMDALAGYCLNDHWAPRIKVPPTWTPNGRSLRTLASRDGGRLLVSRRGVDPFAYLDVVEGVFHSNPAGATSFDAISDSGDRVLSGGMVYDGSFALLGTLPDLAILSGDGRRAFRLESRSDWTVGGLAPVVHVYDLTAPAAGGGALPELGTVDLLDHATCAAREATCAPTSSLVVTPDGRVLFAQTAGGVVVVPIPEALAGP